MSHLTLALRVLLSSQTAEHWLCHMAATLPLLSTLNTEHNRVEDGWEGKEGCHGGEEVVAAFGRGEKEKVRKRSPEEYKE